MQQKQVTKSFLKENKHMYVGMEALKNQPN